MKNLYHWLKAVTLLSIIFVMWTAFVAVQSFSLIVAAIFAYPMPEFRLLLRSILLGQDQLINTFLGGYWKTTISSEIGGNAIKGSGTALKMERVVNWIFKFTVNQDNHCRVSIEPDDIHGTPPIVRAVALTGYIASILTLNWIFE